MLDVIKFVLGILAVCVIIYGLYWVAKSTSYFFFYEGFVQETIREMVKPEFLNK